MDLNTMTARGLAGESVTREEALEILRASDAETFGIVGMASRVRRHFFQNKVKLNYLVSLKSGLCAEDCAYCSQAKTAESGVLKYTWLKQDEAMKAAKAGVRGGAHRVCMVASGTRPTDKDIERVSKIVTAVKEEDPKVEVCACLGFLTEQQARRLKEAGADRYNHNLNTAESHYEEICTTHTFQDRTETVENVKTAGLSPCTGLIAGMGETDEQLVEVAFALRDLGADSIPVNFLLPFEGTPLAGHNELNPMRCLRILAMVRMVNPDREVRCAAGREYHLGAMQPMVLEIVNSIFLGDYLTSEGQAGAEDIKLLRDGGWMIDGDEDGSLLRSLAEHVSRDDFRPAPELAESGCGGSGSGGCGGCGGASGCGGHSHDDAASDADPLAAGSAAPSPVLRQRGAGTDVPANA